MSRYSFASWYTFPLLVKYSFKRWWSGIPPSLKHTEKHRGSPKQMGGRRFRRRNERRGQKSEWWEEDEQTSEDHHVCPPCRLPLFFLFCLALLRFLLFSLMCFCIFFCCYFSPLPLFLSVCFFLSPFGHTPFFTSPCFFRCLFAALQLCTCSPDNSLFSLLISLLIQFMYTAVFKKYHLKLRILVDLATLVVTGAF